jgi:hypothetical protein
MRLVCILWLMRKLGRTRYLQMQADIERVLFDEPAIRKRLDQMAAEITADYRDRELTVIGPAAANSSALEIGLPQCRELSRKSANERASGFQEPRSSRCSWPRCPGAG